jgi:hypothetical protein
MVILLIVICGYFINGYFIMVIGAYSIMAIDGYFIGGYWWVFY